MKLSASPITPLLLLALASAAHAQSTAPAPYTTRTRIPLMDSWSFHKGTLDPAQAAAKEPPAIDWQFLSLPHTWNAQDGQDGGTPYFKGDGWYRRSLAIPATLASKRRFLRFEGANRRAELFIDGKLIGAHTGGNQAFLFDITDAAPPGDHTLAVHVDNKDNPDSPPLQGDFTFFGGLYRPVELVAVDPLHFSLTDNASPGVYITTPTVTDAFATVHVRALLVNDSPRRRPVTFSARISDTKEDTIFSLEKIRVTLAPGETQELSLDLRLPNPHRWNGRSDPYLYTLRAALLDAADPLTMAVVDTVSQPLGIRTFAVDPAQGFLLNGKPYDLHGVNRHQETKDKGWALSEADHLRDMALIKEMGCTAVRLAHYQHSEFFYQLCDKEGMIAWAEIPVVDRLGNSKAFTDNARQQYTELIRQNFNHPSIASWSAGNEVDESGANFNARGPAVYPWFKEMAALGHQEDPSRPAVAAYRERFFPPADTTDLFGLNIYLGWYNNSFDEIETYLQKHNENGAKGKYAITEYGAGASIYFHSENPVRMDHSEEYQCLYHEANWKVLKQHPEVWGKFIWAMFDFASDGRYEGDHAGINDKGLVTHDRAIKKDAFFFYKANWSDEPTLHIAGTRFATRGKDKIPVKVYANTPKVLLTVNGTPLGELPNDNATFLWQNVPLKEGPNTIVASATTAQGRRLEETATFTYTPGTPEEIDIPQDDPMRQALTQGPPRVGIPKKPPTR